MNVNHMTPQVWSNMLQEANPKANPKNQNQSHAYLGISHKNGKTYIHTFANKTALNSQGYRLMSLTEIHEISTQVFASSEWSSAIVDSTRRVLSGFVLAKREKLAKAQAAIIYNLFFSVMKYLAYAFTLTYVGYVIGRKIGNSQHKKQIAAAEINNVMSIHAMYDKMKYDKIESAIKKAKAYAGDNFFTPQSEKLLKDMLMKCDGIPELDGTPELFDQFVDAVIEAKSLNLETLRKANYTVSLEDPHNQKMLMLRIGLMNKLISMRNEFHGQECYDALELDIADCGKILTQIVNTSGQPASTQFHDDNFVFAYNKAKERDALYVQSNQALSEQPITVHESRYLTYLLEDSHLYDYEKLQWIEDNWEDLVKQPHLLQEQYPDSKSKKREIPSSEMRVYGIYITRENKYRERLARLLEKINDSSFKSPIIEEAVLKVQKEHGYFSRGNGDGEFTKAHWDYTSSESQAFVSGTRTLGLMDRDHSIQEFQVELDLNPLGQLTDKQCRDYFLFMKEIDNCGAGGPTRWAYRRERIEHPDNIDAAMALLSPKIVEKLDEIAGKINADRTVMLDIAINYSFAVTKAIALLFANKK